MPGTQFGFIGQKWPTIESGDDGKILIVNAAEDGFDLAAVAASLPAIAGGGADAEKFVRVNEAGDGYELFTVDLDAGATTIIHVSRIASFDVTDTYLAGRRYITLNSASLITVTVPPDLTGTEPLSFFTIGTGTVTFAPGAGVSILSYLSRDSMFAQYTAVSLVPHSNNVYHLIGALAE